MGIQVPLHSVRAHQARHRFSGTVPHRLPLDPSAQHVSALIKHGEIRIGSRSKRTFPVLDSQAPSQSISAHLQRDWTERKFTWQGLKLHT